MSLQIGIPKYILDRVTNLKQDRQMYLNSLAVYAASWYLQCLQFETQHDRSEDWWIQYLSKSAALEIGKIGKIECVPVTGNTATVTLSKDLEIDRVGYLFVRLNEALTSAEIIGFMPKYSEIVRLDRLQSTDDLIDYLCDLESQPVVKRVKLGEWWEGIFSGAWEEIDRLLVPQTLAPALRNRSQIQAVKLIDGNRKIHLGSTPESPTVDLTITIAQIDDVNSDIYLQLHPASPDRYLPVGLKFSVFQVDGTLLGSFETISEDFSGEVVLDGAKDGDRFSIEIEFDGISKIELYEI
ncbi:DUF1822 family protein [Chamaesiphon sp. VAR_48_metabat_403]|uniref:DUF1822 family protein n=1 Tax=Chamaesiphon sp. VAR_48_metabat_403 TaxID=2964700 RepID=UPI00286DAAD4|nr:DUF1822 family protein [Chamaesiphon sp. VAR_48_metabat_403]